MLYIEIVNIFECEVFLNFGISIICNSQCIGTMIVSTIFIVSKHTISNREYILISYDMRFCNLDSILIIRVCSKSLSINYQVISIYYGQRSLAGYSTERGSHRVGHD